LVWQPIAGRLGNESIPDEICYLAGGATKGRSSQASPTSRFTEVIDHFAKNKIYPEVQVIKASEANDTWDKVINKFGRLDAAFNNAGIMAQFAPTTDRGGPLC
jgi:NAD(P)-dependent dehydrogenase (short-subunit alcohol dehydrogenase family)